LELISRRSRSQRTGPGLGSYALIGGAFQLYGWWAPVTLRLINRGGGQWLKVRGSPVPPTHHHPETLTRSERGAQPVTGSPAAAATTSSPWPPPHLSPKVRSSDPPSLSRSWQDLPISMIQILDPELLHAVDYPHILNNGTRAVLSR
jgi:hypothetical protein